MLPADQGLPEAGPQRGEEQRPGVRHQGPVRDPQVTDPAHQETRSRQLRRGLEGNLAEQSRRSSQDPEARHNVPGGFPAGGGDHEEIFTSTLSSHVRRVYGAGTFLHHHRVSTDTVYSLPM